MFCTQNVEKLQAWKALKCGVTVDKWRGFMRDKLLIIKQKMTQKKHTAISGNDYFYSLVTISFKIRSN